MDRVTKSDVKFLRDLANYVESQVNEEKRYIYQNNDSFQEYIKKIFKDCYIQLPQT